MLIKCQAEKVANLEAGRSYDEMKSALETWKTLLRDCRVKLQGGQNFRLYSRKNRYVDTWSNLLQDCWIKFQDGSFELQRLYTIGFGIKINYRIPEEFYSRMDIFEQSKTPISQHGSHLYKKFKLTTVFIKRTKYHY